ncbi:GNAT family N-acetyltransferase [Streptomyces sp. NPDC087532]|uniref:GNAT family N-acetyltransferase n=1 Tax=Streptomyces sp. NPDC087532 TaxID=3365795 RepID=UPI00381E42D2
MSCWNDSCHPAGNAPTPVSSNARWPTGVSNTPTTATHPDHPQQQSHWSHPPNQPASTTKTPKSPVLRLGGEYIGHATVADCGDVYWIYEIRVGREHQGNGYGGQLLTAVLDAYSGDFALSCEQFDAGLSSAVLAAWYARHGFREDQHPDFEHRMMRPAAAAAS